MCDRCLEGLCAHRFSGLHRPPESAKVPTWPAAHPIDEELNLSTYAPKAGETTRKWYVIDATDVVLGRLAVEVANLLRGKNKPTFAPNHDGGDFVIVINAEKVAVSSNKRDRVKLYRHSGFPGGLRAQTLGEALDSRPAQVVEKAIKGMLPKNKLSDAIASKLKVYAGSQHPHGSQQPVPFEIKQVAQ